MRSPFGKTVSVTNQVKSGVDSLGNDTFTETTQTYVRRPVLPGSSAEDTDSKDQVTSTLSVLLPFSAVVNALSKVTVSGLAYEVDGIPEIWGPSPITGRRLGQLVNLRRITG